MIELVPVPLALLARIAAAPADHQARRWNRQRWRFGMKRAAGPRVFAWSEVTHVLATPLARWSFFSHRYHFAKIASSPSRKPTERAVYVRSFKFKSDTRLRWMHFALRKEGCVLILLSASEPLAARKSTGL